MNWPWNTEAADMDTPWKIKEHLEMLVVIAKLIHILQRIAKLLSRQSIWITASVHSRITPDFKALTYLKIIPCAIKGEFKYTPRKIWNTSATYLYFLLQFHFIINKFSLFLWK